MSWDKNLRILCPTFCFYWVTAQRKHVVTKTRGTRRQNRMENPREIELLNWYRKLNTTPSNGQLGRWNWTVASECVGHRRCSKLDSRIAAIGHPAMPRIIKLPVFTYNKYHARVYRREHPLIFGVQTVAFAGFFYLVFRFRICKG